MFLSQLEDFKSLSTEVANSCKLPAFPSALCSIQVNDICFTGLKTHIKNPNSMIVRGETC